MTNILVIEDLDKSSFSSDIFKIEFIRNNANEITGTIISDKDVVYHFNKIKN